jgi:hypothetical protein
LGFFRLFATKEGRWCPGFPRRRILLLHKGALCLSEMDQPGNSGSDQDSSEPVQLRGRSRFVPRRRRSPPTQGHSPPTQPASLKKAKTKTASSEEEELSLKLEEMSIGEHAGDASDGEEASSSASTAGELSSSGDGQDDDGEDLGVLNSSDLREERAAAAKEKAEEEDEYLPGDDIHAVSSEGSDDVASEMAGFIVREGQHSSEEGSAEGSDADSEEQNEE